MIFDAASVIWSLIDLVPKSSWTNLGYVIWDVVSVVVPCLPGSYVAKGGKVEVHHLVEKRFSILFKGSTDNYLSIPLDKDFHRIITNRWSQLYKKSSEFSNF